MLCSHMQCCAAHMQCYAAHMQCYAAHMLCNVVQPMQCCAAHAMLCSPYAGESENKANSAQLEMGLG